MRLEDIFPKMAKKFHKIQADENVFDKHDFDKKI